MVSQKIKKKQLNPIDTFDSLCNTSNMNNYLFKLEGVDDFVQIEATRLDRAVKILKESYKNFIFSSCYYQVDTDGTRSIRILPEKYRPNFRNSLWRTFQ